MELRLLRYFLAVVQEKNISNAARMLHITQPTLSRQIIELETEMETTLFYRGKREIVLTKEGKMLHQRAQEIINLVEKTKKELQDFRKKAGGTISIGLGEDVSGHILAKFISQFSEKYPDVSYDLYNGYSEDIKERLDQGLLDIGILKERCDSSKYDCVQFFQKKRWGILVRKDHPLSQNKNIRFSQIQQENLMIPKEESDQDEIFSWFYKKGAEVHISEMYQMISHAMLFVQRGKGVAVCDESLLDRSAMHQKKLIFLPLKRENISYNVMIWKQDRLLNRTVSLFIQMICMKTENKKIE